MKILVIEDDALLLQGLILAMQSEGYVCDGVSTAHEAALSLASNHYSLVVLDLGLPDEDGLHFLTRMRREKMTQPVLILTARDTLEDRISGLDTGADDYLVKPFAFAELLARVKTLLRRGAAVIVESQFQVADLTLDLVSRKVTRSGTRITLTSKEFTLLEFFIRHQGEVLPRSLIASQVWDMNFDSDTNAIDVAVKRLRAKIDNDFEPRLIQTVRGVGYMLEVPDDL